MTYPELQIQLDLNSDNQVNILENVDTCQWTDDGYLFADQKDGQCYLFDRNGYLNDISKVKIIRNGAFYGCTPLTSISIPNSVKRIENRAFAFCLSLTSIEILDSVESIGNWVFYDCISLKSIKIYDSVKYIGYEVFEYCKSLKEVVFKGKTMKQIKAMDNYPWGIKDKSVIKVEK